MYNGSLNKVKDTESKGMIQNLQFPEDVTKTESKKFRYA